MEYGFDRRAEPPQILFAEVVIRHDTDAIPPLFRQRAGWSHQHADAPLFRQEAVDKVRANETGRTCNKGASVCHTSSRLRGTVQSAER